MVAIRTWNAFSFRSCAIFSTAGSSSPATARPRRRMTASTRPGGTWGCGSPFRSGTRRSDGRERLAALQHLDDVADREVDHRAPRLARGTPEVRREHHVL